MQLTREQFIENDWIVLTDSIKQKLYLFVDKKFYEGEQLCIISDSDIYNLDGLYLKDCNLEVWSPKHQEYCIFYNDNSSGFRVSRFKGMCTGAKHIGNYKDLEGNQFKYCEPYQYDLPIKFKDKRI